MDGAKSVTKNYAAFMTWTKIVASNISWMHCSIDRQALDIKCLPEGLKSVLDNVVKTVNFIKAYPMNTRICGGLCKKMGIIQNCLLTHTKVRSLSCGKVLVHLSLKMKYLFFLLPFLFTKQAACNILSGSTLWFYLVAIFSGINDFNLSLQGLNPTWTGRQC